MNLPETSEQIKAIIQGTDESVVQVLGRARLPATGVIWAREGDHALVVTANHVVEHGRSLRVALAGGEPIAAQIVGRDPQLDLALLRIERTAAPAEWAKGEDLPPVGELVLALGRPFTSIEASLGIIRGPATRETRRDSVSSHDEPSAEESDLEEAPNEENSPLNADEYDAEDPWQDTIEKLSRSAERAVQHAEEIARRAVRNFEIRYEADEDRWPPDRRRRRRHRHPRHHRGRSFRPFLPLPIGSIPLDLTLYPGFSGGPVLNMSGQVLGIQTSAFGNSYLLPHSILQEACAAFRQQKTSAKRAFMGVSGQSVRLPATVVSEQGQDSGLLLTSIRAGSAAEAAGLMLGDILLSLDGERVSTLHELNAVLTVDRIGRPLPLRLVRAGGSLEASIQLGERH